MNQNQPFFKTRKGLLLLGFIIVSLIGVPITVFLLQQQQIFQQQAWMTSQSATALCGADGKVVITANFSNTEPAGAQWAMNVTVRDVQTGGTANIGTVNPGQTKSGTINTTSSSLNAGGVVFSLTWTDGRSGVDTRSASYVAVAACATPSPTPTTPVDTPTPTTPVASPTPTTPVDSPTPTTPVDSPTPTTVTSTNTPTPTTVTSTQTPTPPGTTSTPGPTDTPGATTGPTNTTAPTTVIVKSQPTIAPSGSGDILLGLGFISIMLTLLGGLIFILL